MDKPIKHGGARTGAGRKPKDKAAKKVQVSWTLAPDVVNHIRNQGNQAEYLESLVRADIKKDVTLPKDIP